MSSELSSEWAIRFGHIQASAERLQSDVTRINDKLDTMNATLSELKSTASVVKEDVAMIKGDVSSLKGDVASLKTGAKWAIGVLVGIFVATASDFILRFINLGISTALH
ncbi:MAG: hemolysin XhlA family protein [Firmicutes bacterium]|nr:hemolysin XhlA family protein [Bacillota bacterium]